MIPGFQRCDRCEKQATVHLTEIRGGQSRERHLCLECAGHLQGAVATSHIKQMLKLFGSVEVRGQAEAAGGRKCPECGMSYAEFRRKGRFGCAHDYDVFRTDVERLLQRIHNSSRYTGKIPGGGEVRSGERQDDLSRMRHHLQEAIDAQNYEEAARLRDEIRRLAGAGDGGAGKA